MPVSRRPAERPELPAKRPAFEPAERLLRPTGYDPSMRRPAATIAGVALLAGRVVVGAIVLVAALMGADGTLDATLDGESAGLVIAATVGAVSLLIDAVLVALIWAGFNWPRVVVMVVSTLSISSAFVGWWADGQEVTITGSLLSVALDVLILLALSSREAAAYARRNDRR